MRSAPSAAMRSTAFRLMPARGGSVTTTAGRRSGASGSHSLSTRRTSPATTVALATPVSLALSAAAAIASGCNSTPVTCAERSASARLSEPMPQ